MAETLHDRLRALTVGNEGGLIVVPVEDMLWLLDKFPPPEVTTEWGHLSPWGFSANHDRETAETIVKNMRRAGHEASLAWRGKTKWQVHDGD